MKLKATQLRKGMIVIFNDELYTLTDVMHVTPGKGQASVQTKMKSLKTGTNAEKRFRSDETVEKANLETRKMEYLYKDGHNYFFMDQETFDQIPISADFIGDSYLFMLPNTVCDVNFFQNEPIAIELPATVELKVVETEPYMKTATVTSSYKPATMETGLKVQVPQFIEEGEILRIDTRESKYLERAK